MKKIILFISALSIIAITSITKTSPAGADTLDIQRELSASGTKLLVVEFYATWCKPCMEAVPQWKVLHEKYASKGLRFVVVSVGDTGKCANPGWSPDRVVCDADELIQDSWDVKDLPQAFLYSWNGDLLAERSEEKPVEQAIERYFRNTHLKITVDKVDVYGDKYAVSSNPAWLEKYIANQIKQSSKFEVVGSTKAPIARGSSEHCSTDFPPNSVLRTQLHGDDKGNRRIVLELEKDGCVLASATKPYSGEGLDEDRASLEKAAQDAVRDLVAALVKVQKPKPPQIFTRAGFGAGLGNLSGLADTGGLKATTIDLPKTAMGDIDTDYMDLILAAKKQDKDNSVQISKKISAWQKVANYPNSAYAKEQAQGRIKEWKDFQEKQRQRVKELKKAYAQYSKDKEKLSKLLAYPDDFVPKEQKAAYENEFNRAYGGIAPEMEKIAAGTHELSGMIVGKSGPSDDLGIEWISISAGSFMMGCSPGDGQCFGDENPRHSVNVNGFQIMETEVTQDLYRKGIGNNPSNFSSCGNDCPVEQVSWNEAKEFCKKVGGRLPTEAEWEYAARAGTETKYYCGDNEGCLGNIAWYDENSGKKTHPVKQKQPNAWGLYDMLGHVWEWGEDCYSKGYNESPDCSLRVLRGGSWYSDARYARVSHRNRFLPDNRDSDIGFRCVRDGS